MMYQAVTAALLLLCVCRDIRGERQITEHSLRKIKTEWLHGMGDLIPCRDVDKRKTTEQFSLEDINRCAEVKQLYIRYFKKHGKRNKREVLEQADDCPDYQTVRASCCTDCLYGRKLDDRGCFSCDCVDNVEGQVLFEDIQLSNYTADLVKTWAVPMDTAGSTNCLGNGEKADEASFRGATTTDRLWKEIQSGSHYIVPYKIADDYGTDQNDRIAIQDAISEFDKETCIRLRPMEELSIVPKHYILFGNGQGCSSPVGHYGNERAENKITLAPGCRYKGTITHEILHSLGFWHEQMRPDRDEYVTIVEANVRPDLLYNFEKLSELHIDSLGHGYDIGSVMHYSGYAFTRNGKPTIVSKMGDTAGDVVTAQRVGLSTSDIQQLNQLYGCTNIGSSTQKTSTTEAPCIDSSEYPCGTWANDKGYCTGDYALFMNLHCRKSCGFCAGGTTDSCTNNQCNANAKCTVTSSTSYSCSCNTGYYGDGYTCTKLTNECASSTLNNCDVNAICQDTTSSYTCTCKSGYVGNGITCTSTTDSCTNNQCDVNAECKVLSSTSYSCICKIGYFGNGITCTKLTNECASSTMNNCDVNAICQDTTSSYTCTCKSGYEGNGITCTESNVNECLSASLNDCHMFADCYDEQDGYSCKCRQGYKGDGVTNCDMNQCLFSGLNDCDINAKCTDTASGYYCTCNDGFEGDGKTCRKKITLTNECFDRSTNDCDVNAVCTDTPDSYYCTCKDGFTGIDGKTCTPSCVDVRTECPTWAEKGYCKDNPFSASDEWVNAHCKFSCNQCGCNDYPFRGREADNCRNWKERGFCTEQRFRNYMERTCTKTCGFCTDLNARDYVCQDARNVECSTMKEYCFSEDAGHREYMHSFCKRTCQLC